MPDCQEILLEEISDQILCLIEDNIQMNVTSKLLHDLVEKVLGSPTSERVLLQKIMFPLIGRLSNMIRFVI